MGNKTFCYWQLSGCLERGNSCKNVENYYNGYKAILWSTNEITHILPETSPTAVLQNYPFGYAQYVFSNDFQCLP